MPSFQEWVKIYEDKTGDKHYCPPFYTTLFDEEKGFAQYWVAADHSVMYVYECCGDGKYWYDIGVRVCREQIYRAWLLSVQDISCLIYDY